MLKNLLLAITIRTTVAARRLVRITVGGSRGLARISVGRSRGLVIIAVIASDGRLVRISVGGSRGLARISIGRSRGLVVIAVTATDGRLVRGTVGVVVTLTTLLSVAGGLILIVAILILDRGGALGGGLVSASGRLSLTVGLAVDRLLVLLVAVLSGLGSLVLGLAVMLGLAVPPATVVNRGLATIAVSRGGAGRGLAAAAVARGGAGRGLAAAAVVGTGPNGAGAVAGSIATAAHREGGGVDALAGRDVVVVLTLDVTRRPVLADEHFVAVHSAPDLLGTLPDTLRVITRAL
jgi:hypothetical protein